jgi:hypothetical protein
MSKYHRVERRANGVIYLWPPDHENRRHYGIAGTAVRVATIEKARAIAETLQWTKNGPVYQEVK